MRIAICDDEQCYLETAYEYCKKYFDDRQLENDIEYTIDKYTNGSELIEKAESYDIALLDVDMPGISGIDVKNSINDKNKRVRMLFISSHPENMPEAFGDRVMGFLIKPLEYDKFKEKMNQVIDIMHSDDRFITHETLNDAIKIRLRDIMYIKADGKYSRLYMQDGKDILILKSIGECESEFGRKFVKCHRSWLVNLRHIRFVKNKVVMNDGRELPIGRKESQKVKKAYDDYLLEEGMIWSL